MILHIEIMLACFHACYMKFCFRGYCDANYLMKVASGGFFNISDGEYMKTIASIEAGQQIVQHYGSQTIYTGSFFMLWSAHCPGHRFTPIEANKEKLNQRAASGIKLKPHERSLVEAKDIVITGLDDDLVGDEEELVYLIIAYGEAGQHEWPNGDIF